MSMSNQESPSKNTRSMVTIWDKASYCWLLTTEMYQKVEGFIKDPELHPYYYIAFHAEHCHKLKARGDHYHVIAWTDHDRYSDCKLVRRMRALDPTKNAWSYEKCRKVESLLMYCMHHEKTFIDKRLSDEMDTYMLTLPSDSQMRMDEYITNRDSGRAINVAEMVKILRIHYCHTYDELSLKLARDSVKGDKEAGDLLLKVTGQRNVRHVTIQANEFIRKENTAKDWLRYLDDFQTKHLRDIDFYDHWYSIPDTRKWIKRILDHNGINYDVFCKDIASVLLRRSGKKNCVWIYGPSNAGKSVLCRSIVKGAPTHGQLLPSKDFMFQDCQDQPIIFSEETTLTQDIVSDFKKVAEGTPIHANKKYKEAYELHRTPLICCSNETPHMHVTNEKAALLNRMFFYAFKPFPLLAECTKELHPWFWRHHLLRYIAEN